jgi:putative DNA primase/helicase
MRATVLDRLVKGRQKPEGATGQGQPLNLATPEPWPDRVDGAALLSDMTDAILKYVVMEKGSAEALALWLLHAHALDAFQTSPRLGVTSPEKRCGKTTALDVLEAMAPRPLSTSNTTAAAIFRTIETMRPTLLIDEADTFLTTSDEIRGILNSGHRRSGAFVLRLVGDNHEPRRFSTWGAVAIALIGKLPDKPHRRGDRCRDRADVKVILGRL